ncbi:peroxisomal membrane anchor protein conserved region-domain-containing protein [Ampelomyces quisqualis]|uniref:Peroxisomal membrane protein PEX14 n=1 Tax=Ampelomyces quisqualis TaxID=50730 RepID=A0A6A5R1T6_AMPQU|nr:peroxisomal membrane anchor protein conserved region-domain-containing protein [Ampelomyces quisqualis]
MVREDLITSAISFLQDPSVASAPLEKRIAFLQSKNLTQEEVDVSLARAAAEDPSQPAPPPPPTSAPPNYAYNRPPPSAPSYGYPPQGYWQQPPPPEPPKRDWRDYFIMATVMGGVGYGLYFTAKRYIVPLIQPPTPPQLEQDKASIDESFKRAFDLLEQLNTDTTALKASEEARTTRLDNALGDVETVLASLKESSKRQGDDNRRIEDDVRGLRDLIPKAMDAQKESTDSRLRELSSELKSLKTLVGNRMGTGSARPSTPTPNHYQNHNPAPTPNVNGTSGASTPAPQQSSAPAPAPAEHTNNTETQASSSAPAASVSTPTTEKAAPSSYGRAAGGRAAIPAWQMAMQKKSEEAKKDTSESGTAVDASAST